MNNDNKIIILEQYILSKIWIIKFIMGILAIISAFTISYWIDMLVKPMPNLFFYNIVLFLSGILYYFIVILFLKYIYNKRFFSPESIPNNITQVALIITGLSLFYELYPDFCIFMGLSGLVFYGILLVSDSIIFSSFFIASPLLINSILLG